MGKGGAKQPVTEYYMSMHFLLGTPMDALLEIKIGEKTAWVGEVTEQSAFSISAPELFGGVKKEGGVSGAAYFLPGADDQVLPNALAGRLLPGLTGAACPGFRGMTSIFLVGNTTSQWTPMPGTSDGGGGTGSAGGGGTGDEWTPPGGGGNDQEVL